MMDKMMRVIVGIDFSHSSKELLNRAARVARLGGGELEIVHAVPEDGLGRFLFSNPGKVKDEVISEAGAKLVSFIETADLEGVRCHSRVEAGNPSKILCDEVSPEGGDLLVLSAHTSGAHQIGPVASRCIRKANADVLLVRDWHSNPYQNIVVCTDFSRDSVRALKRALDLALDGETDSFEVIHVVYPPGKDLYGPAIDDFGDRETSYRQHVYEKAELQIEEFCKPFAERLAKLPFSKRVLESDSPAHRITVHLRASGADLVALGTTGQGNFLGLMLGSNAERVINTSPCSVLAVKPLADS